VIWVPKKSKLDLANLDYPKKLDAAGLTEPGSYYQYAIGKIVSFCSAATAA
jgi:hypothetical protein